MPVANFALMFLCHRKNCFHTHKISRLRKKFRLSTHRIGADAKNDIF